MPDGAAASLARLAGPLGLLAVLSGRPAAFLADRVRVPGVLLLGSYGLERIQDGEPHLHPDAQRWLEPVREASRELEDLLAGGPGIRVEHKSVSVAVHWRQAPDAGAAAQRVRQATAGIAAATGLRLEPGKLVEELRPPVDVDKGSAVAGLLAEAGLNTAAYAGDDLGDIPALRAVREAGGYALVVNHGPETDPRLLELADQSFDGTGEFAAWLARLAEGCQPVEGAPRRRASDGPPPSPWGGWRRGCDPTASLADPGGRPGGGGAQFGSLFLGAWLIVSPFILDAKFAIATPMYWPNIGPRDPDRRGPGRPRHAASARPLTSSTRERLAAPARRMPAPQALRRRASRL